jgi:tetrahydromethanopterin S-methyltransferase subunit D
MMIVGRVIVILKKHYKPRQKKRRTDRITKWNTPSYASTGKSQVKARAITTSLKNLSPTIGIYANQSTLFGFGPAPIIYPPWAL